MRRLDVRPEWLSASIKSSTKMNFWDMSNLASLRLFPPRDNRRLGISAGF